MSKLKFLLGSAFGVFMFTCPVGSGDDAFLTPVNLLTNVIDDFIGSNVPWLTLLVVAISALMPLVGKVWKPQFITSRQWLADLVFVSKTYLVTRLVALFVALCVSFNMGPEMVIAEDVGVGMMGLAQTLVALAVALSFVLPFLTDCGIMEFIGILVKPLIRPLFRVPGRASVDLIASWLASSNTAVLITSDQYYNSYYTKREAAMIMTNFSLVSIPFCMVVAETLHVSEHFLLLYGSVTVIGLLLAVVGVRIPPLSRIENTYLGEKKLLEEVPSDKSPLAWAISAALERASGFQLSKVLGYGMEMTIGIIMDLIPIVIAWGTVGTLLVNETSIFQLLSYPMGIYMSLVGIENAMQIAPTSLVGFIDMFIPALITSPDLPVRTRFVVAALSLVQIIYLTEIGSIIVKTGVDLDIKKLFIIFLERTIVAIPLIALVSRLIG